jgi:hypothetical protein
MQCSGSGQWCSSALPKVRSLPRSQPVEGKHKVSGSAGAKGSGDSGRSSKPKLGASGKMSDEQYQKDTAEKLCHICHQPDHIARNCPQNKKAKKGKSGKVAAASGARLENEMPDADF